MSNFEIRGYHIDDSLIYLTEAKSTIWFRWRVGASDFELYYSHVGYKSWHRVTEENAEEIFYKLKPVGVIDEKPEITKNLSHQYEIDKIYAFSNTDGPVDEVDVIKFLKSVDNKNSSFPFEDADENTWKYAKEIDAHHYGTVKLK